MTAQRIITIWDAGTLRVTVELKGNGDVLISGHDLGHPLCEEYEYWITVGHEDVPRLVSALGGSDGDDPLDLLHQNAQEVLTKGEQTWLEEHGIIPDFSNRMGDPR